MNTTGNLPAELQPAQDKLQSLVRPSIPYKHDTVGDSESALEGDTPGEFAGALILAAIMPWWADIFIDGGSSGQEGWQDYFAVTGIASVGTTWYLMASTDLGFWQSFGLGMVAAVVGLIAMIVFHLFTHKCITMFLYNRIFRPSWVKKMREKDESHYREDLATYPERLAKYESDFGTAKEEATSALSAYIASNPNGKKYTLADSGFIPVSRKDELVKDFTEGAKGLFRKLTSR